MNLYEILNIKKTDKKDKIKAAHRKKAQESHPDHGGKAEDFRLITIAYKILSDDEKRARYDAGESVESITQAVLTDEQKAQNILAQIFAGIIVNVNTDNVDLVQAMKDSINSMLAGLEMMLRNKNADKKKFEAVIKRMKTKKNHNLFKSLAEEQIKAIDQAIKKMESENGDLNIALKHLDDFSYEFEQVQVVSGQYYRTANPFFYTSTSTAGF